MRVYVTGLGIHCPLGNSTTQVWKALLDGETAIRFWPDLEAQGFNKCFAARIDADIHPYRGQQLAMQTAQAALLDSRMDSRDLGVFIGSTMGESAAFEQSAQTGIKVDLQSAYTSVFAQAIKKEFSLSGPAYSFGTACAAGNYAIGSAANQIKSGRINRAIAGGVEPFSRIAMTGFSRARAMATDYCRPFDLSHSGMALGEGAAMLILESEQSVLKRGVTPIAEIVSLGLSSDAYHPVAPHPKGEGARRAINIALAKANIKPEDIDWICAHGSGTLASDTAESSAIRDTFPSETIVSAYKGAFGHTLGAATAIEAVICAYALKQQCIPGTTLLQSADPEYKLNIAKENLTPNTMKRVINCGYAFGGLNSALLMEAC